MSDKEPNELLTSEQSLEIISDMIGQAKRNFAKGGSFYFLLWGCVVAIGNLGHYYLEAIARYEHPYILWILTIPAAIASIVYSIKLKNRSQVEGHLDRLYGQVWMAIFFAIMALLIFMQEINLYHNAVILLFAGLGTYISGRMLKFTPLIFGGVALFVASCIAFRMSPLDQNLVAGIAIIVGYIIPGYLLRKAESE